MPHKRLDALLTAEMDRLRISGTDKGAEAVITRVIPPTSGLGRRYRLAGHDRDFLRMNSNGYLGLSHHPAVIDAEARATHEFGAGPAAVRFISGTYKAHHDLESRLSAFHGREGAVIYSSAYAAVLSALASLITPETLVLSDELNHNCIINGIRMSKPGSRHVYPHLDYDALSSALEAGVGSAARALVITDGVFSMRGDYADVSEIKSVAERFDRSYAENVILVVDDSHGVGAYGKSGRGTEEVSGDEADLLIGTLGKAFGVNGGYVAGSRVVTDYLREKGPMYVYSNPITAGEAAAGEMAVSILDSPEGSELLTHLSNLTTMFEDGLVEAGLETLRGPHPIVPLMVRDTERTAVLVERLFAGGVLATGLNYPVVPKGDEEIRFQVNADHTESDIRYVLEVLTESI